MVKCEAHIYDECVCMFTTIYYVDELIMYNVYRSLVIYTYQQKLEYA